MATYKVTLTYQYTHTLEVEACSREDAISKAVGQVDEESCNNDDSWYDASAEEVEND